MTVITYDIGRLFLQIWPSEPRGVGPACAERIAVPPDGACSRQRAWVISGLIQLENKTCARAAQRKGNRADRGLVVPLFVLFSMVNLTRQKTHLVSWVRKSLRSVSPWSRGRKLKLTTGLTTGFIQHKGLTTGFKTSLDSKKTHLLDL